MNDILDVAMEFLINGSSPEIFYSFDSEHFEVFMDIGDQGIIVLEVFKDQKKAEEYLEEIKYRLNNMKLSPGICDAGCVSSGTLKTLNPEISPDELQKKMVLLATYDWVVRGISYDNWLDVWVSNYNKIGKQEK